MRKARGLAQRRLSGKKPMLPLINRVVERRFVLVGIHGRFTCRMHDPGEFMEGLQQRHTQWHNRTHSRANRLWEKRFRSVIVEDAVATRTMAA
jgi:hypothetical protein